MNNDQVIQSLKDIIDQLSSRRQELQALQNKPGGPLNERMSRQNQIYERLSAINVRIYNLQVRLHERELSVQLGKAVPPLDPQRAEALLAALKSVSQSIQVTGQFKDAISVASAVSEAASNAHAAT